MWLDIILPTFVRERCTTTTGMLVQVEGAKVCKALMQTETMRVMNARPNPNGFPACSHLELHSDEYLECHVSSTSTCTSACTSACTSTCRAVTGSCAAHQGPRPKSSARCNYV